MTVPAVLTIVVLVGLAVVYGLLREQGPLPAAVLVGRYTVWPFLLILAAPFFLLGLWARPTETLLAVIGGLWLTTVAGILYGWGPGTIRRAVRRCRLRAMWPSVARSANLAVRHDRRSPSWPGGVTSTVVAAEVIEHLPRIWHGRALPGGVGVTYYVRPAKGATLADITAAGQALAAGLAVHSVTVERLRPNRGLLHLLYTDTLTGKAPRHAQATR